MMQRLRLGAGILALALLGSAAWAATPLHDIVPVASDRGSGADDYERGFNDGLNGRDDRERDKDYRAGYSAGRAKHKANEARPDGRDFARGYRDGFNHYRERKAVDSKDRAYAAGYNAGQAEHTRLATAAVPGRSARSVESLVGRSASSLDSDMKALGFARVIRFKTGKETISAWESKTANRCVQVTDRDGRVREVKELGSDGCRQSSEPKS